MHRVTGVVLAAALAGGSCFVALAPGAAATSSSTVVPAVCGATLTHDTTLTHDLHCTTGPGLILLGNVSLNLGGHGIYGPGTAIPGYDAIDVQGASGGSTTVTNGRIQNWLNGIVGGIGNVSALNVSHMKFTHLGTAIATHGGVYTVSYSAFRFAEFGINGQNSVDTVTRSTFYQVRTSIGNASGGGIQASYDSFTAPAGPTNETLTGVNNVQGNSSIDHSTFHNIPNAVNSFSASENLTNVTIAGAVSGYSGDEMSGTLTNVVFSHDVTGIELRTLANVTVTHGQFQYNGTPIYLWPNTGGLPSKIDVASSTFSKNLGDGVNLDIPGSSLKSVHAFNNVGHGINAVAGTHDLGGNRAHGNAQSPQCIGVVCTP